MSNGINPMDHRILGKLGTKIGETGTTKTVRSEAPVGGQESAKKAGTGDTVELTSSAKLLERLEKTLSTMPEIHSSRVAAVKAQIENGEYQIDVEKIADALIRADKEIGS